MAATFVLKSRFTATGGLVVPPKILVSRYGRSDVREMRAGSISLLLSQCAKESAWSHMRLSGGTGPCHLGHGKSLYQLS